MDTSWSGVSQNYRNTVKTKLIQIRLEPIVDHPHISPENIMQRPKVVYSEGTAKYHVRIEAQVLPGSAFANFTVDVVAR